MTNENLTVDVISRLKYFMEQMGVSVTQFADNTGIQRSSMSQILSGRNQKISIITIGKIYEAYPNLSLTWLLSGKGAMLADGELPRVTYTPAGEGEKESVVSPSGTGQALLTLFGNESAINADERPTSEKYATENGSKNEDKNDYPVEKEEERTSQVVNIETTPSELKNKRVVKIMIFYSDNTFEAFSPDSLR